MHPQTRQTRQITHIVGLPRVARQVVKSGIGGAQGIAAQRVVHFGLQLVVCAFGFEKVLQLRGAGLPQHTALQRRLVVQSGLVEQVQNRPRRARFGIKTAKHHAFEACMQHRTRAHGTRLQRHKQLTAIQPVVAQRLRRRTQCQNFSMGGGVMAGDRCVAAGGDDFAILHHHRAHRHLARRRCALGFLQGELHERSV